MLLVSDGMPEPITFIARHAWLVVRGPGEPRWQRLEIGAHGLDPLEP